MSIGKQSSRFLVRIAVLVLAIGAFAATSASAATWTVEGSKLSGEGTANGLAMSSKLKAGTTATMKGVLLGQEFVLTSTTLSSSGGTIFQEGSKAKTSGVLEFSGLTVDKPAGCSVESPIKTKALTGELVGGHEKKGKKTTPEEGEVFATIKVSGCAVAGSYNVKGVVYAEDGFWGALLAGILWIIGTKVTHTFAPESKLTLGTSPVELTAEIEDTLASGKKYGADE
jgi:hypothetical protein